MPNAHRESKHHEITYVVHSERMGLCKIGHTSNLTYRMRNLRAGCPDAEVVRVYQHGRKLEHYLRKRFRQERFRKSEWHEVDVTDIDQEVGVYENELAKNRNEEG